MTYLVTAILQDNREQTIKVCARTETSFDAVDAIVDRICETGATTPEIVEETWSVLYLSCMHIEELPHLTTEDEAKQIAEANLRHIWGT